MEVWKQICESKYAISNHGRVRNSLTGRILKTFLTTRKYESIHLPYNGKRNRHSIHRLVAEYFIENLDNKPEVDHINRNKIDNKQDNLRWVTKIENAKNKSERKRNKISIRIIENIISLHKKGLTVFDIRDKI